MLAFTILGKPTHVSRGTCAGPAGVSHRCMLCLLSFRSRRDCAMFHVKHPMVRLEHPRSNKRAQGWPPVHFKVVSLENGVTGRDGIWRVLRSGRDVLPKKPFRL